MTGGTRSVPASSATGSQEPVGSVLVCGGGVAGIQASLDLSAAGFRVYLVEESASIGGGMARLDKTFPTGDCATCIISPKLVIEEGAFLEANCQTTDKPPQMAPEKKPEGPPAPAPRSET